MVDELTKAEMMVLDYLTHKLTNAQSCTLTITLRNLSDALHISHEAARRALNRLVDKKLIEVSWGRGRVPTTLQLTNAQKYTFVKLTKVDKKTHIIYNKPHNPHNNNKINNNKINNNISPSLINNKGYNSKPYNRLYNGHIIYIGQQEIKAYYHGGRLRVRITDFERACKKQGIDSDELKRELNLYEVGTWLEQRAASSVELPLNQARKEVEALYAF